MSKTNGGRKRKGKNWKLRQVGVTIDGRRVLGGIFPLVSSEGIPLEMILGWVTDGGDVIDWFGFWQDAMKHGWSPQSTRTKIETCVGETLGPKVRKQVSKSLKFLYEIEGAIRDGNEDECQRLLREQRDKDTKEQRTRLLNTLSTRGSSSDG